MNRIFYHYYLFSYKLWHVLRLMDKFYREVSTSTTNTFLCPKRGYVDVRYQRMEPGDADNSHFEEMYLQDRILRVLNSSHVDADLTFLYKNENFLYDPSALSYYEDETETANNFYEPRNIVLKTNAADDSTVIYYPRPEHAELVMLGRNKNVFQRFFDWLRSSIKCIKPEPN